MVCNAGCFDKSTATCRHRPIRDEGVRFLWIVCYIPVVVMHTVCRLQSEWSVTAFCAAEYVCRTCLLDRYVQLTCTKTANSAREDEYDVDLPM